MQRDILAQYMYPVLDIFLILFVGVAAGFDVWKRKIPNWLVLLAACGGILLNALAGVAGVSDSLLGIVAGIGVLLVPFALGWVGAGDVKMLGAVGAVLGLAWIPRVLFYSALAGGACAIVTLAVRGIRWKNFAKLWYNLKMLILSGGTILPELPEPVTSQGPEGTIPYGVAIAAGTLVAFYLDPDGTWSGL